MATPEYPMTLPGPGAFTMEPTDQVLATDTELGPKDFRRLSRQPSAFTPVVFRFLEDDYAQFVDWWKTDLKYGHKWFWINLPSAGGITWHVARFAERYVAKLTGHRAWEVTAKLELRERQFEPNPRTSDLYFFIEDFESGLDAWTTISGNPALWHIVPSPYGEQCLVMDATSGGGVNNVQRSVPETPFDVFKVKFRVTSIGVDDAGVIGLLRGGTPVLWFCPVRETYYDAVRRPWMQLEGTAYSFLGAASITVNHWYELEVVWNDGAAANVTITDLTADSLFLSTTKGVTVLRPVVNICDLRDDNSVGSCATEWDDITCLAV